VTKLLSVRFVSSCLYSVKIVSYKYVHLYMFNDIIFQSISPLCRDIFTLYLLFRLLISLKVVKVFVSRCEQNIRMEMKKEVLYSIKKESGKLRCFFEEEKQKLLPS